MEQVAKVKTGVYRFSYKKVDGHSDMKNLLGGNGTNLDEMSSIGISAPPGFTIRTQVFTEFNYKEV